MDSIPQLALPAAAVSGVALHIFFFQQGEHHMHGVKYLQVFLLAFILLVGVLVYGHDIALKSSLAFASSFFGSLLLGIFASLLCYRLVWHPLRNFPGPFGARISSLWFSSQVTDFDAHKKALELYQKYGPFVRVGSSDLMVVHPLGVPAIHGAQSKCRKSTWYDEDYPRQSIHTSRDPQFHSGRRRLWSQAFGDRALRGYEDRLAFYNKKLIERLAEQDGEPVNAAMWANYYSFDVMGDLAFNKDFGMLQSGQQHWAIGLLDEAMNVQGLKLPTWLFRMMVAIPGLTENYWKFIHYCDEQLAAKMAEEEKEGKPETTSLISLLIDRMRKNPTEQEHTTLQSDARTIIVAGSDTTASTMSYIFYQLASHPEQLEILREELLPLMKSDGTFDHQSIQNADHLNAVINESLRLNPVPPTAIVRKTPPEGIMVDDTFIPRNMNVWTPQYVIGRSELTYEQPNAFVPERWYSKPAMVKEKAGYAPFLTGPYGCIGRPLALMELRMVIAEAATKFEIEFPPGKDGSEFIENVRDRFTWGLADLSLCFRART